MEIKQKRALHPIWWCIKRSARNTLWIHSTLATCYLPHLVVSTIMLRSQPSLSILIAQRLTAYLINLNSFLNPTLYYWKIREIRQAVKGTFLKTFCFFFLVEQAQINEVEYIKVHTATRWTIRHGLMLLWFADLMNVT